MTEMNNQIEPKVGFFRNIIDFLRLFGLSVVLAGFVAGVTGSIAWSIVQPQSFLDIVLSTKKGLFGMESAWREVHIPTRFNWADVAAVFNGSAAAHIIGFIVFYLINYDEFRKLVLLNINERIRRVLMTWVPILAVISGILFFLGILGLSHKSTYDIAYVVSPDEQGFAKQVFYQLGGNSPIPKDIGLKLDSEKEINKINFNYEKNRELGTKYRSYFSCVVMLGLFFIQFYIWNILLSNILRKEFKTELEELSA